MRASKKTESQAPRRVESRLAPLKGADNRQHARPGAGIKRSRGVMVKKPRGQ